MMSQAKAANCELELLNTTLESTTLFQTQEKQNSKRGKNR